MQVQLGLAECQRGGLDPPSPTHPRLFLRTEDLLPVSGILHGPDAAKHHGEPGIGERL